MGQYMKWIPCGENSMPPWNEEVIVTVMDDSGDTPFEYTCSAWWFQDKIWISDNDIVFGEVVAWMPMPKPYKKENPKVDFPHACDLCVNKNIMCNICMTADKWNPIKE